MTFWKQNFPYLECAFPRQRGLLLRLCLCSNITFRGAWSSTPLLSAYSYMYTSPCTLPDATPEPRVPPPPTPTPTQRPRPTLARWVEGWYLELRVGSVHTPSKPSRKPSASQIPGLDCRMRHPGWTGAGSASLRSVVRGLGTLELTACTCF